MFSTSRIRIYMRGGGVLGSMLHPIQSQVELHHSREIAECSIIRALVVNHYSFSFRSNADTETCEAS